MSDLSATFDDSLARRNAFVLSAAQALGGANAAVVISTGGLVGHYLAADKTLSTLPVTFMVLGLALATLPASLLMRRIGRRLGFMLGAAFGSAGGFISAFAIASNSFWGFCAGAFFCGIYAAFIGYYRFAAADAASPAMKPRVISWVLTGGLFAALLGPQLVIHTKDLMPPYLFAASFVAQGVVGLIAIALLATITLPIEKVYAKADSGRPIREIIAQRSFIVAALCGVVSYALMSFVMTATPLAMVACDHTTTDALYAIQWHVIAMFAPSYFTGRLIGRFGAEAIIATGLALLVLCGVVGLMGLGVMHFNIALVLLGLGWNFGYIGATTLVTQTHTPAERAKAQGANDLIVNASQAIASFSAGGVLSVFGWHGVTLVVFPPVLLAMAMLVWNRGAKSRAAASVA
jgi:MFS family permease